MDEPCEITIIDFSAYRLSLDKPSDSSGNFEKLVEDVHNALTTIGFFFITNTDFPKEKVEEMYKVSKDYFNLPLDVKLRHPREVTKGSHGYVNVEAESLNPGRQFGDLKETFNFNPMSAGEAWPEAECPAFKTIMNEFFKLCLPIHNRVLEVMARGLKLKDPLFFVKHHAKPWTDSAITLRTVYYPPLTDFGVKEHQIRCGEHSDFGGITLLFQQKQGLQVCKLDGCYIKVPMVEDAILINTGNLMERWTADIYPATKHRVLLDETEEERKTSRQSIAFFGFPDKDAIIECIDGSNKYPPITSEDYMNFRFQEAYRNAFKR